MIESGSHLPGVDVDAWHLPPGTAVRYERPAAALRPFLASYVVLDSDPARFPDHTSWVLPGSAKLWFAFDAPGLTMKPRSRPSASLGMAMLVGPTSRAMPIVSHGGISVIADLTPRGWARFVSVSAEDVRDRILPLVDEWPAGWADDIISCLQPCGQGLNVKAALDDFFARHLPPASRHEALIGGIERLIVEREGRNDVSTWHSALDASSSRTLARVCNRYFGFSPKVLQRRARFLRTLTTMLLSTAPIDFRTVPPGYHDTPHFLRDAQYFLGMTAKQFLDIAPAYLLAVLRARLAVAGSPLTILDGPPSVD